MDAEQRAERYIEFGVYHHASDLYIQVVKEEYHICFRCQDQLFTLERISLSEAESLILYFKFMGEMDVGEHRLPQDGSTIFSLKKGKITLRLSTVINFAQQENLVIRFLYPFCADHLYYFQKKEWQALENCIQQRGLHLFSGPVGSGKTTSMYQLIKNHHLNEHVITIEDPVEIIEPQFLQLQIQNAIGLDYETLIKLCLRQRPDILVIGEIRDDKTAKYAYRASLSGHRVFATIHSNSLLGVYDRLYDLGIPKEQQREVIRSITYQRLLPVYCPLCQGRCQPYCERYAQNYRLYMETTAYRQGEWNHGLQKWWALGAITKETWQKEKQDFL